MELEGLLRVDKASGRTSHDEVARARRLLGIRRVGHAGTLDPFATGLLLLLVGKTTRLARFLVGADKSYSGLIRLGVATDTGDRDGEPTTPAMPAPADPEILRRAARSLEGPQDQVPPAFSAKKIDGQRAHRLARAGRPPRLPPVPVTVYRFEPGERRGDLLAFRARVSSGTYIRRLAQDLGEKLGCGAHLAALRRETVGSLGLEGALVLDEASPEELRGALMPPAEIPLGLPSLSLTGEEARAVRQGRRIAPTTGPPPAGGPCRMLDPAGRLIGVGEPVPGAGGAPEVQPRVVLD